MPAFLIITAMPGYLPEADPIVFPAEASPKDLLAAIRDEIACIAPDEADEREMAGWSRVLGEVDLDLAVADTFIHGEEFRYELPDGYAIAAVYSVDADPEDEDA